MLDLARDILGSQPILCIFLAIGLGYLVGQINIFGFSLGVGAVLFVGLAIGAIAPKAAVTGPIGLIGLIMFLYGIGILYGKEFFEGMTGAAGRKYNLLAFVGVIAGLLVALGVGHLFGVTIGQTLGLYAGSMTSTATLQAALDVMRNSDPSVGYSVAYPFGVIGPILCIYFITQVVRPKFPPKVQRFHMGEVTLSQAYAGRTLDEMIETLPEGVQVSIVRKESQNIVPAPDLVLNAGDSVLIVADRQEAIAEATRKLGQPDQGRIAKDRSALNYIRVFVSKAALVGVPLGQLPLPAGVPLQFLHLRRYDMDIVPRPDLTLEIGDRVGLIVPPDRQEEVRRHFGDSVKSTAEFSYISLGIGMVLGVLLGLIPIPIPGVGKVTLGITGGPLIVALILGKLRKTGPLTWVMPLPANGRHQCGPAVREDRLAERIAAAVRRHDGAADHRDHRSCGRLLPSQDSVRRPRGRCVGRDRQSGDPGVLDPHGADRAARYRLRDDLPVDDAREGDRGADRRFAGDRQCRLSRRH